MVRLPRGARSLPKRLTLLLLFALPLALALATIAACEGCRPTATTHTPNGGSETATARLYLVSDLAGAIEPCGCVKDQLGGMDHFGGLVAQEKSKAGGYATLAAGPLFFMDMDISKEKRAQEVAKAATICSTLKTLGLAAFAPGRNAWAADGAELQSLAEKCGPLVAANLTGVPVAQASTIKDVNGLKIGIVGVASPDKAERAIGKLEGVTSSPAVVAVKAAADDLKKKGAQVIVVLAAVGRGEAKRIADENPDLLAIVVGTNGANGDVNTKAPPAERIGDVLVVETANHLQTVAVLDLYVREAPKTGLVKFADATGIDRVRKREELTARIDELRTKIAVWEKDKSVDPKDVEARKADVVKLEAERDALDKTPAPASGSFYRYAMREIREKIAVDETVKSQMLAYYKKVNDANKAAFADAKPPPVVKGQPSYAGIDACVDCHDEPKKVWDKTAHARAYATLSDQFKEYNLDCVSCHVTGFDQPGGSTVTHVASLKNVQCEVCHGPGSLHVAKSGKVPVPVPKPTADRCVDCHHPPHVHTFDANAKMAEILGPGHGKPVK